MFTDYKLAIVRTGTSTVVTITLYEGDYSTLNEWDFVSRTSIPVTRYRRINRLGKRTFTLARELTEDQIRRYLNARLAEDPNRTPIPEQTAL